MIPRYAVKGKIGDGGLGEVYLATDTQLDRDVALKRVKPPASGCLQTLHQDLIREARTLSSLQHPHIVTIYDVGQDELGPFVVMEYLKGETLDQVIQRGALTVEDFQEVVAQSLEGMIAAQDLGLVHRDLKPDNLMVVWLPSGKFQIKILDFGLAKFSRTASLQTQDHEAAIMGTIFYMAPEQFERRPLDARTDMYSLGCIYYQILTTHFPFTGHTGPEVMVSHLQHQVRHLAEVRPDLPPWLADWVMWLISREMPQRPADARAALAHFRSQKADHSVSSPHPKSVKILGRGVGPRSSAPPSAPSSAPSSVSSAAAPAAPPPAARRPAPKPSAPPKSRALLWVALAAVGAASAAWWFSRSLAPPARLTPNLESLLAAPSPPSDPASLEALLDALASNSPDSPRAAAALKRLPSASLTEALTIALAKSSGAAQLPLLDLLTARPSPAASALLLKIAAQDYAPSRAAALQALAQTAAAADSPALFKILPKLRDPASRDLLLRTAQTLLDKETAPDAPPRILTDALREADQASRPDFLRLLGQTAHPNANRSLAAELATAGDRRRDALAALPAWPAPDPTLTDALLAAAAASPTDREALLAAFCQIAPRIATLNGADLTNLLRRAQAQISSTQNRAAFCAALASTADPEAAAYAQTLAADPTWAAPATQAAADIAALLAKVIPLAPGENRLDASKALILAPEKDTYYTSTSRYLTNWKNPASRVAWDLTIAAPATISLRALQSTSLRSPRSFRIRLGNASRTSPVQPTDSNETFTLVDAGSFTLPRPGTWRLWLEPARMEPGQPLFNLREIILTLP